METEVCGLKSQEAMGRVGVYLLHMAQKVMCCLVQMLILLLCSMSRHQYAGGVVPPLSGVSSRTQVSGGKDLSLQGATVAAATESERVAQLQGLFWLTRDPLPRADALFIPGCSSSARSCWPPSVVWDLYEFLVGPHSCDLGILSVDK